MAVPVVPAKAGTQSLLDSGFRRNDVATQSDIIFENRYKFLDAAAANIFTLSDFMESGGLPR